MKPEASEGVDIAPLCRDGFTPTIRVRPSGEFVVVRSHSAFGSRSPAITRSGTDLESALRQVQEQVLGEMCYAGMRALTG